MFVRCPPAARLRGWSRLWIVATVLWAVPSAVFVYSNWQRHYSLESVQNRYVERLFEDLGLAIDKAEGGRLTVAAVDKAADELLGKGGRSIAGFEALARDLPIIVPRMKRVPFAAPENGMEVRYFVFPVEASDEEISAGLATEASRRQLTEWAQTEPVRLDLIVLNSGETKRQARVVELETLKLLADYQGSVEQVPNERLKAVLVFLGMWLVPSIVVYALGSTIGWVIRGFRNAG